MINWKKYYNLPLAVGETEYLKQVGKTVNGQPISEGKFQEIVTKVCQHLELSKDDVVLDLCCGNGLITKEIAKRSRYVVGVDFSHPLLSIAQRVHQPHNVRYLEMSLLELTSQAIGHSEPFTKVYMYEALQHFDKKQLATLLTIVLELSHDEVVIFLGSVPDRSCLWKFYNTPKYRFDFFKGKLLGQEAIGTWWNKSFIQKTCHRLGLHCEFLQQDSMLHTAHYRFDMRIRRNFTA